MYRKQMKIQKILCIAALAAAVVVFLYSLGILTDLYDSIYNAAVKRADDPERTKVPGSTIYFEMQGFNSVLVRLAIGMILLSLSLFVTNTHVRRKYYPGNYITVGLFAAGSAAFSVWAHERIMCYRAQYLQMDFEALKNWGEKMNKRWTDSTFWFDAHYAVFGLLLLVSLLLILNVIWKILLMNSENKLLRAVPDTASSRSDGGTALDRMRYTKNKRSSQLCYLAILADVMYFICIYKSDVSNWYYTLLMGAGIVYNLLFMLLVFLGSEALKNYKKNFHLPLVAAGAGQIVRIFILPLKAHTTTIKLAGVETLVMGDAQFMRAAVYLVVSAVCLIAAAAVSRHKCRALENYEKSLEDRTA